MYDTLVELKQQKRFKKVWGDTAFYGMVTVASASILGGFIAGISLESTLYATLPFTILSIPVAFTLVEPKRHKLVTEKGYTAKLFEIFKDIHTNINFVGLSCTAPLFLRLRKLHFGCTNHTL